MVKVPSRPGGSPACAQSQRSNFLLDKRGDRRLIERIHRLIQRADHHLGGQSGQQRRTMQVRGRVGMVEDHRVRDHSAQRGGDFLQRPCGVRKKISTDQAGQGRCGLARIRLVGQRRADNLGGLRSKPLVQLFTSRGRRQELRFEQASCPRICAIRESRQRRHPRAEQYPRPEAASGCSRSGR